MRAVEPSQTFDDPRCNIILVASEGSSSTVLQCVSELCKYGYLTKTSEASNLGIHFCCGSCWAHSLSGRVSSGTLLEFCFRLLEALLEPPRDRSGSRSGSPEVTSSSKDIPPTSAGDARCTLQLMQPIMTTCKQMSLTLSRVQDKVS